MQARRCAVRAGPDGPGGLRRELIRLVTRLVVAQTFAAAAVGLPFSRRHLPSILITLALVAALAGLALLVRSGTRAAWLVAVAFELAFIGYGLSRFFFARYLGGTLLAILAAGTLAHPAVAGAFSVRLPRRAARRQAEPVLGGTAGDAFGGQVAR
jgi:hypothetical protein